MIDENNQSSSPTVDKPNQGGNKLKVDRPRFSSDASDDSGFEGLEGLEPFDLGIMSSGESFRGFQSQPSMDSGLDEEGEEAEGDGGGGATDAMPDVSFFSVAMQMRLKDKETKVRDQERKVVWP